ncbi:MAG: hypothetical protein BAJALOKI1v1_80001 [Promethearchaeota archaeon]|nr:MAG: hypothetical protein BAJALOKI1v1_80001 [Candidatus Lokiarchaeota archaeon]
MENTIQKTGKILGFLGILLNSLIIVVYIVDVILRYNNGTSLYDVTFGNPFFVFGLFIIFICCLSGSSRRRW